MAIQIQLRQGTTTEHSSFTGAVGEVTVDTSKNTLVLHDGVTAGGYPLTSSGEVVNNLTTNVSNKPLSAAQGKVLKDLVDTKLTASDTVAYAEKLTTATGSAPSYSARAWVNFRSLPDLQIFGQGNVSSITEHGVGDYTINFTTPLPSANYAVALSCGSTVEIAAVLRVKHASGAITQQTTSALRVVNTRVDNQSLVGIPNGSVVIYL